MSCEAADGAPTSSGPRTCDACLGFGLARPKHWKCAGGDCSCCGSTPSTRVRRPTLTAPAPAPRPTTPRTYVPRGTARGRPSTVPPQHRRLIEVMFELGASQSEVARCLNIPRHVVSYWHRSRAAA